MDVGEAAVASDGEEGENIKINVDIPEELKFVLVSDWDLLTHKKSSFSLPGIPAILAQIDRRKKIGLKIVYYQLRTAARIFSGFSGS